MSDDDEPTEEELAEAEALARALDRGTGDEVPDDALETAALVRYSHDGGVLADDRKSAIWAEVLDKARVPETKAQAGWAFSWLKWLVPAFSLAAATAVAVVVMNGDDDAPSSAGLRAPEAELLPLPETELLQAQARAASGAPEAAEELERRMRTYRSDLYAALEERYR
jgi:hypothetical protein